MVLALVLLAEMMLFLEMKRRIKILTAADCVCVYVMLYQYIYFFADSYGYVINDYGQMGSFMFMANEGVIFYFYIFLIAYGSSLGLTVANDGSTRRILIERIQASLKYQKWFVIAFYGIVLIYFSAVDFEILMSNDQYLLLRSARSLHSPHALARAALSFLDIVGILSAFFFSVNLFLKRVPSALLFLPLYAWGVMYAVANSSRVGVVLFLVPALIAWILLKRFRLPTAAGFGLAALYILDCALSGRSMHAFGLAEVPAILASPFGSGRNAMGTVFNLLQGVFVTMDGFTVPGEHPDDYKILSFSPLPSFIDGFSSIMRLGMIKLALVVPMSAITEVVRFGPAYTAVGALMLFLLLRQSIKAVTVSPLLYAVTLPVVMMLFVQANAYPLRNVFRQAIYVYIFMVVAGYFAKRRRKLTPEAIAAAPLISRYRQQAGLPAPSPGGVLLPPRQAR